MITSLNDFGGFAGFGDSKALSTFRQKFTHLSPPHNSRTLPISAMGMPIEKPGREPVQSIDLSIKSSVKLLHF
jgi:hypothetical protein